MGKGNSVMRPARHTMTGVRFPTVAGLFLFATASRTVLQDASRTLEKLC